jgi:MSHA biogenesis protein MshO
MDVSRRAELTAVADTALYRLAGDVSTAVPNSIRVAGCGGTPCVEFIPAKEGGRYRASAPTGVEDLLDFTAPDGSFEIIGAPIVFGVGDVIIVGSTQSDGNPPYDTTAASGVQRAYTGVAGAQTSVSFTATQFPAFAQLPSQRFDVVDAGQDAITYACEGAGTDANGDGTGVLRRYWNYGFNVAQANPPVGGSNALLATNVSTCAITYDATHQRLGLLSVQLTLTRNNESSRLYHEIHVINTP